MSRTRSALTSVDRRRFLSVAGAVTVSTGLGVALGAREPDRAVAAGVERVGSAGAVPGPRTPVSAPAGRATVAARTTLDSVAVPRDPGAAFLRLQDGPGWRRVVREDLARARVGRPVRRSVLTSFVQLTDLHMVDVQHPVRTEYLRAEDLTGWRPQEALSVPGAVALVERINALRNGPATGAPLAFAVTTGDNTDNNSHAELDWFLTVMSGGRVTPNTGDPRAYEGVQTSGVKQYWHPESTLADADKHSGYPRIDGYLAAAMRSVDSPGLRLPWYSTIGNHDGLASGTIADRTGFLADFAVGDRKLFSVLRADAVSIRKILVAGTHPTGDELVDLLRREKRNLRPVTPDPRRAPFTPHEYVSAHLDPARTGPGPHGHGFTAANLAANTLYYTFPMGENITGISLDTTDRGGYHLGSVGSQQLAWLDATLDRLRDSHVVVFSHHNSWTMTNTHPDPAKPREKRHTGQEVVALLKKHRNVRAWVNGHSHRNRIVPHGTFWEISTASHVDRPHLARIIEIANNGDGTLSLFTTLIESGAPSRTDFGDLSQTGLSSLYRELAYNAPGLGQVGYGSAGDRNTELVLKV